MVHVLVPGRHHLMTTYLERQFADFGCRGVHGKPVEDIIVAVTSANHSGTRRNPLPLERRLEAIVRLGDAIRGDLRPYPIKDIPMTPRYAEYILKSISEQGGPELTPTNTVVATSTPDVIMMYERLGFKIHPLELEGGSNPPHYHTPRAWEVVELLAKAGKDWRTSKEWRALTSGASQTVFDKYSLGDKVFECFNDVLLGADGDITGTRDYDPYGSSMDRATDVKWDDIRPFVIEGKIVDEGCGSGALVGRIARDCPESDVIGVEATRAFYDRCMKRDFAQNPFVFFHHNNITDDKFRPNSLSTKIYSSVMHEVFSYLGIDALRNVLRQAYQQLQPGGRIVIRDPVAPDEPDKTVLLRLSLAPDTLDGELGHASPYERFRHFARDFIPYKPEFEERGKRNGWGMVLTSGRVAADFLGHMMWTDNWKSEMHEAFTFGTFDQWCKELKGTGFTIVPQSRPFRNDYIIKNHWEPRARLQDPDRTPIEFPYTTMILAGEKPAI